MSTLILSLFALTATSSLLVSSATTTVSLLSLNCTPPPPPPPGTRIDPSLARHLDWLANQTAITQFASSSMATNATGLVHCQPRLNRTRCSECVQFAKRTVSTLCPNSESFTAWLDACYVEASVVGLGQTRPTLACSCSDERPVHWVGYQSAFNTLLMRLMSSGVAFGAIQTISDDENKIHGYVECIRSIPESECRSCVERAVDNLNRSCGGRAKGYALVVRKCVVRFEAFSTKLTPWPSEEGKGGGGKRRLVLVCWGVVFVCLVGFVLSVWLIPCKIAPSCNTLQRAGWSLVL